jgi:hypothetical protein
MMHWEGRYLRGLSKQTKAKCHITFHRYTLRGKNWPVFESFKVESHQ